MAHAARILGNVAFANKQPRLFRDDQEFIAAFGHSPGFDDAKKLKAYHTAAKEWYRGWDKANCAAIIANA